MLWRVRTTLTDRPGILADIARACGKAEVNILGMQVFPTMPLVTDEFIIGTAEGWADLDVAELFVTAGGGDVAVTRATAASLSDAPTRWLNGVHQVLEEDRDVADMLGELLETDPPDVADYTGHDVLEVIRRGDTALSVSRAVPFTMTERARAQAFVSLVGESDGAIVTPIPPSQPPMVPVVRDSVLSDQEAVVSMHERCSADTLYARYQAPLPTPLPRRLARRLVLPDAGVGLVIQIGTDIVGHGVLAEEQGLWAFHPIVEDTWQGRGLGARIVKHAAGRAKGLGADHLTFITAGSNDRLLRAVGHAGFVARVVRHEGNVHITVPLGAVRAIVVAS